nr:reverse transcriptase domain-containing protein [Tanacetum cinerariifolium]
MADQRTMGQLLQAPTEGYEDAIVVPIITADNFKLKHGPLTLFQNKKFFGQDKEDPHAHVRYFNKITSTLKFQNVPNTSLKLMLFPFSLEGAARILLEKEPPRSIFIWDDLVLKFINHLFPPSKTTNLRNEITNFQQRFDESFIYNALNSKDQDSLNSAAGGNFLDKMPRECLAITESKLKVHYSRKKPVVSKVSTNTSTSGISSDVGELKDMVKALLLDKKGQNQSLAPVKAVKESCVTCGGAHSYRNCPATDGNVYHDNIQEFVSQASTVNYNQGNTSYRPPMMSNQIRPPGFPPFVNSNSASTSSSGTLHSNTIANPRSNLKSITSRSGVSYDGPQIPSLTSFLPNVVEDELVATKDTMNPTNNGSTEDVQPQVIQSKSLVLNSKPITSLIFEPAIAPVSASNPNPKTLIPYPSKRNNERNREKDNNQIKKFYQIFKDMSFKISFANALIIMPKFSSTLKALIRNKEKLREMARTPLNEHCSTVLLKKLPEKLGDQGKFLIPCDIPGMAECLALADLCASINLNPFSIWKRLSPPDLTPTCMTLELADRLISRLVGVAEDVYVKVGSFYFSADFAVVDFDADHRVPLILGRSFLKTGRALIAMFKEVDAFLAIEDDPTSLDFYHPYLDPEGDILLLEAFLNDDPSPPPSQGNYLPKVRKELKICEAKSDKSSVDEPLAVELKDLPPPSNMRSWKVTTSYRRKSHSPAHTERLLIAACLLGYAMLQARFRERMLKWCEDTNLCLNWEKSHFMVKEGIVLDHKISKQGIEVDKAKVDVITKLPHPTTVKAHVKAVKEICVTCRGAHPYYQCLAAGGNTFPEYQDNIQGYISAATCNYNQGNPGYRPQGVANQMRPLGFAQPNVQNNQNQFGQPQGFNHSPNFNQEQPQIDMVKNKLRNEMKTSIQISLSNQTNEIKNIMASLLQMNIASTSGSGTLLGNTISNPKGELKSITTRSGLVTEGPTVPNSPKSVNPEEDECVEETYTDPDHAEYNIKVLPNPPVQKPKPPIQRNFVIHARDSLPPHIMYPFRMLKQKQQEKDDIQIQKFWNMFKQLHLNITLAEALVLMTKYQKMLKALLSNKEKLQELTNTPLNENCSAVILKKLPKKLGDPGKFLIPCGFSELKCKALADLGASINLMPLSVWKKLGLHDLIPTQMTLELANRVICTPDGITRDVFVLVGKFTFLADFVVVDYESDPKVPLILGRPFLRTVRALIDVHGEEMILRDGDERLTLNMKHDTSSYFNHPYRESVNLINIFNLSSEDCLKDLVSYKQSGNPTFSLHKEIASPEVIHEFNDSKGCTFLSEELLDIDSFNDIHPHFDNDPLSGSTTYSANSLLEEFADELALISYPSDYDDSHLIDQSVLTHCDDLFIDPTPEMFTEEQPPDYSFPSRFDVDDVLFSPDNEDKVFNQGILSHDKSVKIITEVTQEKKLSVSYASWLSEDFDPPFSKLRVFKEVLNSIRLLSFSSKNEEKVFKPGIYTFKKFHCYFLSELSHLGNGYDKKGTKSKQNRTKPSTKWKAWKSQQSKVSKKSNPTKSKPKKAKSQREKKLRD